MTQSPTCQRIFNVNRGRFLWTSAGPWASLPAETSSPAHSPCTSRKSPSSCSESALLSTPKSLSPCSAFTLSPGSSSCMSVQLSAFIKSDARSSIFSYCLASQLPSCTSWKSLSSLQDPALSFILTGTLCRTCFWDLNWIWRLDSILTLFLAMMASRLFWTPRLNSCMVAVHKVSISSQIGHDC